ncbi:Cullin-4B [Babesia sp. Xinjiang]|uniref:Cullin-4B n=1 Tax=Babesia sp. Xinjiang TaxID=462227 RepID=UPI000A262D3B|nr:Cullin-4B [Babesia sp. Xinjiang]ORM42203.1 Cullin-4B [Babesia sp. Xinjiang]
MELTRAKPRQYVEFRIPLAESQKGQTEMGQYVEQLKGFAQSVLLGQSCLGYNKLLIMGYIQEAIRCKQAPELSAQLDQHLKTTIESMFNNVNEENAALESQGVENEHRNEQILNRIELCWCHLRAALSDLIQVCSQLESAAPGGFSIWKDAMQYFKENLEAGHRMKDRLMVAMLDKIALYRNGGEVTFCQLRNIVEMFTFVNSYDTFEEKVIAETRDHYRRLAEEVLSRNPVTQAYSIFREKIQHEEECCSKYLIKSTVQKVLDTLKVQVLQLNAEKLMKPTDLKNIINSDDIQSMKVLLALYADTEWISLLHDAIFDAAQRIGDDITGEFLSLVQGAGAANAPEQCFDYIRKLHGFKMHLDATVKNTLPPNVDFKAKEHNLWQRIINANDRTIEATTVALAAYADGAPNTTNVQSFIEEDCGITFIMRLFRAIVNKSKFEILFRSMISTRLLYEHHLSQAHEQIVIKLREECGAAYVSKLEVIISDYKGSSKVATEFPAYREEYITQQVEPNFDFSALVVSKETSIRNAKRAHPETEDDAQEWEDVSAQNCTTSPMAEVQLQVAQRLQTEFAEFYSSRHKNRSVTYLPDLGSALVEMEIKGESYELKLSICQAYCLLSLNTKETISLSDLREVMGEEYNEIRMRKHMAPLNAGENPVVTFIKPGLTFENCTEEDSFELNPNFVPEAKLCDVQFKDQILEQLTVTENANAITEDITPIIEATIVRHLKSNLVDKSSNVFKVCVAKHSSLDRFEFNKILDSLAERDFVKVDTQADTITYVP